MGTWTPKYSHQERTAIIEAGVDRGIRPISAICRLAAAGELTYKGDPVAPFEIPNPSCRYIVDTARRGREGKHLSDLAAKPPKDAIELLRRRFINLIDYELTKVERASKRTGGKPIDAEFARKLLRMAREAAAMPGPDQVRLPRTLGSRSEDGSVAQDQPLRDSLARSILSAEKTRSKPTYIPDLGVDDEALPETTVEDEQTDSAGVVGSSLSLAPHG